MICYFPLNLYYESLMSFSNKHICEACEAGISLYVGEKLGDTSTKLTFCLKYFT